MDNLVVWVTCAIVFKFMWCQNFLNMSVWCYRSDNNVGRIVNRVATFRNIANDLLRTLMIKSLIEY